MLWQSLITTLIVLAALAYVIRGARRILRGKAACGCGEKTCPKMERAEEARLKMRPESSTDS